MTSRELNRAVARATGESISTIERLGFFLEEPPDALGTPDCDEPHPDIIDKSVLDAARALRQPQELGRACA